MTPTIRGEHAIATPPRIMMLFRWPTRNNTDWLGPLMSVMHTQKLRETARADGTPDWFTGVALDVVMLEGAFVTMAALYEHSTDSIQLLLTTYDEPGNRILLGTINSYLKAWGAKFVTGKAHAT
jgi:hypothetical protein